ncbi:hypothetical protein HanHA300_Chr10g0375501 [Helianthus annuus]|nr:hypothetical protein HanHA300_Chr10g0375501 [Helianthus annuus]KAJ0701352.1 hypothetical protein HanOQP8_Chr10g0378451 [Helianthus annuus]
MKGIFMRVLFCKSHCPSFICFCKPSTASHLYNSNTLKLENSHHAPQTSVVVTDHQSDHNHVDENHEIVKATEKEVLEDGKQKSEIEICVLRSCMKNKCNSQSQSNSGSGSPVDRKKVQWVDNFGKQLVDIREFESRLQMFGPPLLLQRSADVVRKLQTFYL